MVRKGAEVERLTKKVGQHPETGKVIAVHDEFSLEILWDDGHTSIVSKSAITPVTEANRPHKED